MPVAPLNPWPRRIRAGWWGCRIVSLGLTLLGTCNHRKHRSQMEQAAFGQAAAEAAKAAVEINRSSGHVRTITNHIASDLVMLRYHNALVSKLLY